MSDRARAFAAYRRGVGCRARGDRHRRHRQRAHEGRAPGPALHRALPVPQGEDAVPVAGPRAEALLLLRLRRRRRCPRAAHGTDGRQLRPPRSNIWPTATGSRCRGRLRPRARTGRADRSERIQAALDAAYDFFRGKLRAEAVPQDYLRRRKVPPALGARFGVGFAPDGWRALVEDLGRRLEVPDLEAAGLVARSPKNPDRAYDRFRNRLMFPIRSPPGRPAGIRRPDPGRRPGKVRQHERDRPLPQGHCALRSRRGPPRHPRTGPCPPGGGVLRCDRRRSRPASTGWWRAWGRR